MRRFLYFILPLILEANCGMYISCHKDNPVTPKPPGHSTLALRATFVSTRWVQLSWNCDSSAASRSFVLLRNDKDTVFAGTSAKDTATVIDSGLVPSSNYSYQLFRMYNKEHWDSASIAVHTVDTTKDNYTWDVVRLGLPGSTSTLRGVWGTSPNDIWLSGIIDSGATVGRGYNLVHIKNGASSFYPLTGADADLGGCYGTSDSDVWICGDGTVYHWTGSDYTTYSTGNDSFPSSFLATYGDIWETPDGKEIYAVGSSGKIIHRKADGKWELQPSSTNLGLGSIVGFSANDIYASGGYSNFQGVLTHYDGSQWSTILSSVTPDSSVKVANMGVGGNSPDSLYVVGNGVYHRRGAMWVNRTPANQTYYAEDVYAQAWNNVFVCGNYGLIMKFDGDHWVIFHNGLPSSSSMFLNRIIVLGNEVFIVGGDDGGAYFIHGH